MKKAPLFLICLLLCSALAVSASAATVYPLPSSISIGNLRGQELPVDITWEGGWEARMTIYAQDFYSASDLAGLRVGDSILIEGRLESVRSIVREGDSLMINETAENCYSFYDEYGNGTFSCTDSYFHTTSSVIGALVIDPNIRFTCLDYLDRENMSYRDPPLVYSPNEFIEVLKTDRTGFRSNFTYALFDADNLPKMIYRYYSAIESY